MATKLISHMSLDEMNAEIKSLVKADTDPKFVSRVVAAANLQAARLYHIKGYDGINDLKDKPVTITSAMLSNSKVKAVKSPVAKPVVVAEPKVKAKIKTMSVEKPEEKSEKKLNIAKTLANAEIKKIEATTKAVVKAEAKSKAIKNATLKADKLHKTAPKIKPKSKTRIMLNHVHKPKTKAVKTPVTKPKAKAKPTAKTNVKMVEVKRSDASVKSWKNSRTAKARSHRTHVKVIGHGEFKSVRESFDQFKIPMKFRGNFRLELIKKGKNKITHNGKTYSYIVTI